MTSTKANEDFPGAYSGQGRSWERKTREAVGLLSDKHGYSPGVVLQTRPPATITATAVSVPAEERQQYGRHYIGVDEGGTITPRKLATSLGTPAPTVPLPPMTPGTIPAQAPASDTGAGGSNVTGATDVTGQPPNLMPIEGDHQILNPEAIPDAKWKKLKVYVYNWILAKVGEEHRYLVQETTQVGDIEQSFKDLRGVAESNPKQFVETMARSIEELQLTEVSQETYAHQLQVFCAKQYGYFESIEASTANGLTEDKFVEIMIKKQGLLDDAKLSHAGENLEGQLINVGPG